MVTHHIKRGFPYRNVPVVDAFLQDYSHVWLPEYTLVSTHNDFNGFDCTSTDYGQIVLEEHHDSINDSGTCQRLVYTCDSCL